jgi:hypothetical protein
MDIMEPRRLEAWREFSRWLEVMAFIAVALCPTARPLRKRAQPER